jgi:eukaryotic-like serine/threonine-protein kinase
MSPPAAIGPYTVAREIGRGGMGVVYLAHDMRLDRAVAIKALPEHLAADPERLARFEREARTLASLSHPNIAGIFGLEEHAGARYLVLELVEGQTLAEMLDRGPLPVDEAIGLAAQIAAGVEAAHEAGVIHRDLKPGNIIVSPEGNVKVLDFGLARVEETSSSPTSAMIDSPTLTSPAIQHSPTMPGVILGTAAYMSPEQARGRKVDKRTDIWSFGVVLYEMLTGASPFYGETVSDSIGAVLHKDLELDRLPPGTPANVRRVLDRCLERDKAKRYRDIGDVAMDLRAVPDRAGDTVAAASSASGLRRLALLAVGFLFGAAVIAGAVWLRPAPPAPEPPAPKRFGIGGFDMPIDAFASVAISPAADSLVVRSREPGGEVMLRVRPLGSLESRPIPGSESAWLPFYSPDGQRIAFFTAGDIRVASVSGGEARRVTTTNAGFTGGTWMDDGSIIFTGGFVRSLHRVDSTGGEVETLEAVLPEGADFLAAPSRIPGTDAVLCVVGRAGRYDIGVYSRADGRVRILAEDGFQPVYAATGHVIYQRADNGPLMALPFDAERLVETGPPFEIRSSGGVRLSFQSQLYAIAADGTFVSIAPEVIRDATELVRVDAAGEVEVLHTVQGVIDLPRLSRDGRRVAYRVSAPNCDIWVLDLERGTTTRITREGDNHGIVWSADDEHIITYRRELGNGRTVMLRADGIGEARDLHVPAQQSLQTVAVTANDAQVLLTGSFQTERLASSGLGVLDVREQVARIVSDEGRGAALSPDGQLIAYDSMQSGRSEVYLQPWPELDERVQVSTGGGAQAAWSRDGKTLYYRSGGHLYATDVQFDGAVTVGRPVAAFEAQFKDGPLGLAGYEPDGAGRVIAVRNVGGGSIPNQIEVVLNFFTEIERLDPARRQR